MILCDSHIIERLRLPEGDPKRLGISPLRNYADRGRQKDKREISSGLTSAGYDLTLANEFLVCDRLHGGLAILDPKRGAELPFTPVIPDRPYFVIPAGGFALARSVETVEMPHDVCGTVVGKSTMARIGIIVNTTPIEPAWQGVVTLELSNTATLPAMVYIGEGIAQLQFHQLSGVPMLTYADKGGIYQHQDGVTLPRIQG